MTWHSSRPNESVIADRIRRRTIGRNRGMLGGEAAHAEARKLDQTVLTVVAWERVTASDRRNGTNYRARHCPEAAALCGTTGMDRRRPCRLAMSSGDADRDHRRSQGIADASPDASGIRDP